jgi:hypothetical protein
VAVLGVLALLGFGQALVAERPSVPRLHALLGYR